MVTKGLNDPSDLENKDARIIIQQYDQFHVLLLWTLNPEFKEMISHKSWHIFAIRLIDETLSKNGLRTTTMQEIKLDIDTGSQKVQLPVRDGTIFFHLGYKDK